MFRRMILPSPDQVRLTGLAAIVGGALGVLAVAGVIGTRKFQYDLWGDTVNTASRMESHGEPGRIQISDATHDLIKDQFVTTPRGSMAVKGKGTLTTWWLEGEEHLATAGR